MDTIAKLPAPMQESVNRAVAEARSLQVSNQAQLTWANEFLGELNRILKAIGEVFDPQVSQAHALHKSLLAEKAKHTGPLEIAKGIVSPKVAAYLAEEDRKAQEKAREKARAERLAQDLADKATDKAFEFDRNGETERADQLLEESHAKINEILAAAPGAPQAPRKDGLALRTDWKFRVTHPEMVPREYLVPDEAKIGRMVRAAKGEINIPGVLVFSVKSVSKREA